MDIIVSCSPGLEKLLQDEIKELCPAVQDFDTKHGAIAFRASENDLAQIYVFSKLASRLHLSLKNFAAQNPAMLYDQIRRVPWDTYFGIKNTFQVQTRGRSEFFEMSFATLKIKDAVCDEFRKRSPTQERPSVNKDNPDFTITAFFDPHTGRCDLSLDLTLEVLHRRGYRKVAGKAPIRENKAAALVRLLPENALDSCNQIADLFCGSGTLLFEYVLHKFKAPRMLGIEARDPLFKLFPATLSKVRNDHENAWTHYRSLILENSLPPLLARDWDEFQIDAAKSNAQILGLTKAIRFEQANALDFKEKNVLIMSNPPFGERLGDAQQSQELLQKWGRQIKFEMSPCTVALALARTGLSKHLGFRPNIKIQVDNGPVPLELSVFQIYAGASTPRT